MYSFCWKPKHINSQVEQKLVGVCADGRIVSWTVYSGNKLEHAIMSPDADQSYQAIGYSIDGIRYVAAGDCAAIDIYDELTQKLFHRFAHPKHNTHTNKVFVAKFSPMCVNLAYTGGWDKAVKFWDIRTDSLSAQIN